MIRKRNKKDCLRLKRDKKKMGMRRGKVKRSQKKV